METLGALSTYFLRFIRDAARLKARRLSLLEDALSRLIHSMAQRILVAFVRTQALHSRAGVDLCPPVLSHIPVISTAVDLLYVAHGE